MFHRLDCQSQEFWREGHRRATAQKHVNFYRKTTVIETTDFVVPSNECAGEQDFLCLHWFAFSAQRRKHLVRHSQEKVAKKQHKTQQEHTLSFSDIFGFLSSFAAYENALCLPVGYGWRVSNLVGLPSGLNFASSHRKRAKDATKNTRSPASARLK